MNDLFDYITFSLTLGLRTVYLLNLKNLICVDIVKCQVKFCLLLDFLHIILFLKNLASAYGRMKSVGRPHVARGLDSTEIDLSASPYYTLWCKSDKTNNSLYFNSHHP